MVSISLSLLIQYEESFEVFFINKSFLNSLIINPVGVKTIKKTNPIMIGEIIDPKANPNLNQARFNGVKILELIAPKIKNISDNKIDQILISAEFNKGHNPKIKNTMKKTKPKLLLEFILSFFLFK